MNGILSISFYPRLCKIKERGEEKMGLRPFFIVYFLFLANPKSYDDAHTKFYGLSFANQLINKLVVNDWIV